MKVLHYSDSFGGATSTFIYNEVKYLSTNHEFKYLCTSVNKSVNAPNVDINTIVYSPNKILNKLYWYLWRSDIYLRLKDRKFSNELNKFMGLFDPDIIHLHFGYEAIRFLDNYYTSSKPLIIHFHGYDASQMLQKKSYVKKIKYYIDKSNVYPIYVSDYMKNVLNENSIDVDSGFLLRYGIDVDRFRLKNTSNKHDKVQFLQISSLNEKKGHIYTIKAFHEFLQKYSIADVDYRLIFTGDGHRRKDLENECQKLGISELVEFVGVVSSEEAIKLLMNADIFLHHSITAENGDKEGIPNAIMEAMSMELPIISTYHAGIPELVKNGTNGYLVQEKDISNYAIRMRDIATWSKQKTNRRVVVDNYNMDKHVKKLENIYYKLLKQV